MICKGSGIRDPPFEILRSELMRTDCMGVRQYGRRVSATAASGHTSGHA